MPRKKTKNGLCRLVLVNTKTGKIHYGSWKQSGEVGALTILADQYNAQRPRRYEARVQHANDISRPVH